MRALSELVAFKPDGLNSEDSVRAAVIIHQEPPPTNLLRLLFTFQFEGQSLVIRLRHQT